jgi:hypothetical protein
VHGQRLPRWRRCKPSEAGEGWRWDELLALWCQEGFSPAEFWEQTPRTFSAWSKGRGDAAKRRADDATVLAWRTALFTRTEKKLRLSDFLVSTLEKRREQTPDEMLAVFRTFVEMGTPLNIRKLN